MTRTPRRQPPHGTPAPENLHDRTGIIGASEAGARVGEPVAAAERGGLRHAALVMGAAAALFFVGWLGTPGGEPVPTPLETAQAPIQAPPRVIAQPEPVVESPVAPETRQPQRKPKQAKAVVAASESKPKPKKPSSAGEARSALPPKTSAPKPKNPVKQIEDQFEDLIGPVFDQMVSQARSGR
ncbi:hypothetical protein L3Q67_12275 [Saccharothrix sp. AJ9571]|nr:hypothetical protein L3Q67_12275 [Saccharothrix sp. AJ9571]